MMAVVMTAASTTNTAPAPPSTTPKEECTDVVLEVPDTSHKSQVCTGGMVPGLQLVKKGLTAKDASESPLCNSPEMATSETTLKWYTPLGVRSVMSPEVVTGGKL